MCLSSYCQDERQAWQSLLPRLGEGLLLVLRLKGVSPNHKQGFIWGAALAKDTDATAKAAALGLYCVGFRHCDGGADAGRHQAGLGRVPDPGSRDREGRG